MEWKHTDFPVKKKFWAQQSGKKMMLTVFWNMKEPITIDFREKAATVNSTSYCQLLRQNSPYLLNDLHAYACVGVCVCIYIYIYIRTHKVILGLVFFCVHCSCDLFYETDQQHMILTLLLGQHVSKQDSIVGK